METEEVELARIFKKDGSIHIDFNMDTHLFELYGYLKCFVKDPETSLIENFEDK